MSKSKPMLTHLWAADKFELLLQSSLDKAVIDFYTENRTVIDTYLRALTKRLPAIIEPRQTYEPKQVASIIWAFIDSVFCTYMGAPLAHYMNGLRLKRSWPKHVDGKAARARDGDAGAKLYTLQTQLFGYIVNYFIASQLDKYFATPHSSTDSTSGSSTTTTAATAAKDCAVVVVADVVDPSKQLVNSTRKLLDLLIALGYLYHLTPYHSTRSWVLKQRFVYASDPDAIDYRSHDRLARVVYWICFTFLPYAYVGSTIARGVIDHCHASGYYSWATTRARASPFTSNSSSRHAAGHNRDTDKSISNQPTSTVLIVDRLEPPPQALNGQNLPPGGYCPLCKNPFRGCEGTLACCGVVFCYSCVLVFVQKHRYCPVGRNACCENDIIKLNY